MFQRDKWVDGRLDAGVNKTFKDLEKDAKKIYESITLGIPGGL